MRKLLKIVVILVIFTNYIEAPYAMDYNNVEISSDTHIYNHTVLRDQRMVNLVNQYEKDKKEMEERIRLENERKEKERREEEERKHTIYVVISFYTDLPEENGGCGSMTSSGKKLQEGMVASINELPIGTVLESKQFGTLVVEDRMHRGTGLKRCKNGELPIDVFVPRQRGESISHYKNRVYNMGIVRTSMKLVA